MFVSALSAGTMPVQARTSVSSSAAWSRARPTPRFRAVLPYVRVLYDTHHAVPIASGDPGDMTDNARPIVIKAKDRSGEAMTYQGEVEPGAVILHDRARRSLERRNRRRSVLT